MTQKRTSKNRTEKIIAAALACADKTGWESVTIEDIAKKAKLKADTVYEYFPDVWVVIKYVLKKLDKDVNTQVSGELSGNWRDDLFEVLMTRFELMEDHRDAYASLLSAFLRTPHQAPRFMRHFGRSMQQMLDIANAPSGPVHTFAFGGIYASLVESWKNDETPDLAKTMAAVDKRLDMYQRLLERLPICG